MLEIIIMGIVCTLLLIIGMPIAFALGLSGAFGIFLMGKPLITVVISMFQGMESWVLLAVPSFIFAGVVMEKCGISFRLIELARSMVGWLRGGLGMTTIGGEILFSGVSGSTIADVSVISTVMAPPMVKAGYEPEQASSIIAASTCLGILIPPAIFMIVVGTATSTSVVGIFLGAVIPGIVAGLILMVTIYFLAYRFNWPVDAKPSIKWFLVALKGSLVSLIIPVVIIGGFRFGVFTATEAGAVCALYSFVVGLFIYRNVTLSQMKEILIDSAVITSAVVFLLATATIYQYIMSSLGVPHFFLRLLDGLPAFACLSIIAFITLLFGLVMEGIPAAVILLPVVFPVIVEKGINPIHFCIVITLSASVGLFLPPTGAGLLLTLRLTNVKLSLGFLRAYFPYIIAILIVLIIIILFPSLSLILPNSAGLK